MRNKEEFYSIIINDILNAENDKYVLKDSNYFFLKTNDINKTIIKMLGSKNEKEE